MSDYTTRDAVEFALDKDVGNFKAAVTDILSDKISAAIEASKINVASTLLQPEEYADDQDGQGEEDGAHEV
jgi:hypothetical protein